MKTLCTFLFLLLPLLLCAQQPGVNCQALLQNHEKNGVDLQQLYQQAKQDKEAYCQVQALLLLLSQQHTEGEISFEQVTERLKQEATDSYFPANAFLHCYLGQLYLEKPDSASHFFALALKDTALLQQIPASVYGELIKATGLLKEDHLLTRQRAAIAYTHFTLYDLLCHWIIYSYLDKDRRENSDCWRGEQLLWPLPRFLAANDKGEHPVIKIFRQWLTWRNRENTPTVLIDTDLLRLRLGRRYSLHPQRDSLYVQAMQYLIEQYRQYPAMSSACYQLADHYEELAMRYDHYLAPHYRDYRHKARQLCQQALQQYPGDSLCRQLLNHISQKQLRLCVNKENLPKRPFKVLLSYRNVSQLHYRLFPLSATQYDSLRAQNKKEFLRQSTAWPCLKQGWISLPDEDDLQSHHAEIALPALPAGEYLLLVQEADNPELFCYEYVQFSSLLVIDAKEGFFVLDRNSGAPLQGLPVQLELRSKNTRLSKRLLTDARGFFRIPYLSHYEGRFIINKEGELITRYVKQANHLPVPANSRHTQTNINWRAEQEIEIFTGRGLYATGDSLHFSGWVKGVQTKDDAVEIRLWYRDDMPVTISRFQVPLTRQGSFNAVLQLPTVFQSDRLFLEAHHRKSRQETYTQIAVYKRKNDALHLESQHKSYRLGERIVIKGRLSDSFMSGLAGKELKYSVYRSLLFPWQSWRASGVEPRYLPSFDGSTRFNAQGEFEISFWADLKDDFRLERSELRNYEAPLGWRYQLYVSVPGNARPVAYTVLATEQPLLLDLQLPAVFLTNTQSRDVAIVCSNSLGENQPAKGHIRFYRLKHPGRPVHPRRWLLPDRFVMSKDSALQLFPFEEYGQESNIKTWEVDKLEALFPVNTDSSNTLPAAWLDRLAPGAYRVEMQLTDAQGQSASLCRYLTVYNRQARQLPYPAPWLALLKNWDVVPGEEVMLTLGTAADNGYALLQRSGNYEVKQARWIRISGQQQADSLLSADGTGCFLSFARDNHLYRTQIEFTVSLPGFPAVQLQKEELAPQKKKLNLQLSNSQGQCGPFEITVWLVKNEFQHSGWYRTLEKGYFFANDAHQLPNEGEPGDYRGYFYKSPPEPRDDYFAPPYLSCQWDYKEQPTEEAQPEESTASEVFCHLPLMYEKNRQLYKATGSSFSHGGYQLPLPEYYCLFFRPQLRTDASGKIQIEIELPEGRGSWELKVAGKDVEKVEVIAEK